MSNLIFGIYIISYYTLNLFNLSKYKGILEEFYSLLKIKLKSPKVFENAYIHFEDNLHCVPGESILCHKYAFIKKSTIFTQSLRNFVKMRYS